MNTRVALVAAAVVVVIVAAIALSGTSQPMPLSSNAQGLSVSTSTIMASTTEYTVDASYPQFGTSTVDSQIASWIAANESDLTEQADRDKPLENGYPLYTFTCIWDSPYIGPDYLSARIVCGSYTGGAHEMPVIMGADFDRTSGQPVTLDGALALTGMTLDQVASSSKAQLAEDPDTQPTGIWASGSDPTAENYRTFLIDKDSVIFIFQPYQVAPFSSGAPEVSIPRIK